MYSFPWLFWPFPEKERCFSRLLLMFLTSITSILFSISASICGHQTQDRACDFICATQTCVSSCNKCNTFICKDDGITTLVPHKIQPFSKLSSFFCEQEMLSVCHLILQAIQKIHIETLLLMLYLPESLKQCLWQTAEPGPLS